MYLAGQESFRQGVVCELRRVRRVLGVMTGLGLYKSVSS